MADLKESFKQGSRGLVKDRQLLVTPWGFELEDIPFGQVLLWYKMGDKYTMRDAKEMEEKLPHAILIEVTGADDRVGTHADVLQSLVNA